jgi:hypothetical protein
MSPDGKTAERPATDTGRFRPAADASRPGEQQTRRRANRLKRAASVPDRPRGPKHDVVLLQSLDKVYSFRTAVSRMNAITKLGERQCFILLVATRSLA